MSPPVPFVYRLKGLAKVVDGDTLDLGLDLGFSLVLRQRVRFYGLDAPEVRSKDPAEKSKGLESQAFVSQWFAKPWEVLVRTTKEEKYGRMLAYCSCAWEPSLSPELLERGLALARPYNP